MCSDKLDNVVALCVLASATIIAVVVVIWDHSTPPPPLEWHPRF